MTVVAHLSDPHFGTEVDAVAAGLQEELRAQPADLLVVTGDVTQRARRGQFLRARAFLDALPAAPRLLLPGNHDIPLFDLFTRVTRPYRLWTRYLGPELEPAHEDEALTLLCVNATRATRRKHGVISSDQIERTARRLETARGALRVVAVHHPLAVPVASDARNRARGADAALERWIDAGADLVLGGHIHLPYCISVASRAGRRAILLQAGTAVSRRVRRGAPNSYNRIVLERGSGGRAMCIERRDWDASAARFHTAARHEAAETRAGWTLRTLP